MPNSATLQASLTFANSTTGAVAALQPAVVKPAVSGSHYQEATVTIPTTAGGTAIPLGGVVAPGGLFCFKNLSTVNTINILTAHSGTAFLTLYPGEVADGRLAAGITAPHAIAVGGAADLQYLILDA